MRCDLCDAETWKLVEVSVRTTVTSAYATRDHKVVINPYPTLRVCESCWSGLYDAYEGLKRKAGKQVDE